MFHSPAGQRTAQCAEIRHIPVQSCKLQETFDEPGRLPERHAEKDLHRQAGLDGVRRENSPLDCFLTLLTAVNGLSPSLAGWLRSPRHARIEPALRRLQAIAYRPMDRQRPAALERVRHCARTNGASMAHYTRASSGSCKSVCSVCSCLPAIALDSQDEPLSRFGQQSRASAKSRVAGYRQPDTAPRTTRLVESRQPQSGSRDPRFRHRLCQVAHAVRLGQHQCIAKAVDQTTFAVSAGEDNRNASP